MLLIVLQLAIIVFIRMMTMMLSLLISSPDLPPWQLQTSLPTSLFSQVCAATNKGKGERVSITGTTAEIGKCLAEDSRYL